MTSQSVGRLNFMIRQEKNLYNILLEAHNDAYDDSLYREYNQNEGFQGNFRNLLRQIIDDQDYREVVDNPPTDN